MSECFGYEAFGKVGIAEIGVGIGVLRLKTQRGLEMRDRLGPPALSQEQFAKVFVPDGEIRLQLEGQRVMLHGRAGVARSFMRSGQHEMREWIVRSLCNRIGPQRDVAAI